jgi:hypothetical protein
VIATDTPDTSRLPRIPGMTRQTGHSRTGMSGH